MTMDIVEAIEFGFSFDLEKGQYYAPNDHCKCFPDRKQIIDLVTGDTMKVEIGPRSENVGLVKWNFDLKKQE